MGKIAVCNLFPVGCGFRDSDVKEMVPIFAIMYRIYLKAGTAESVI